MKLLAPLRGYSVCTPNHLNFMSTIRQKSIAMTNVLLLALLLIAVVFSVWLAFFAKPAIENVTQTGDLQKATYEPERQTPNGSPVSSASGISATASGKENATPTANGAANVTLSSSPEIAGSSKGLPKLLIPVAGIKAEQLRDTYTASRSENRTHNAIDIMAGRGTPVLAAEDGSIKRMFVSERGGNAIYQLSSDAKLIYYYAHLERFADDVTPGKEVKQGEVIGYVGDTGNAGAGNYHLHFSIWKITDPKRFWDGENINPYPLLH
jgi:murein DD-endopeptidase MepM/ murein hydrolase activator NlpD